MPDTNHVMCCVFWVGAFHVFYMMPCIAAGNTWLSSNSTLHSYNLHLFGNSKQQPPGLPLVWRQSLRRLLIAGWLSCGDSGSGEQLLNENDPHRAGREKRCQNTQGFCVFVLFFEVASFWLSLNYKKEVLSALLLMSSLMSGKLPQSPQCH